MKQKLYDVHILVDTSVLTDVLAYIEDHGEVLSLNPHTNGEAKVPRRKKTMTTLFRLPGKRMIDAVLEYIRARELEGPISYYDIKEAVKGFGYKPNSASPAVSKLAAKGFIVKNPNGTYSSTAKKGTP